MTKLPATCVSARQEAAAQEGRSPLQQVCACKSRAGCLPEITVAGQQHSQGETLQTHCPLLQAMNSSTAYLNAVNFPDTMVGLQ